MKKKQYGWVAALALSGALMIPLAADAKVYLTMELSVVPEKSTEFLEVMTEAAHDTRAFQGNELFHILVDKENPGNVLFYEIWDSQKNLDAYRAWRTETDFPGEIGPYMAGPPKTVIYEIAE